MKVKISKMYDEHKRVQIDFPNPSLTEQDCKEECDINYIIESYVKRGELPPQPVSFGDCTTVKDFQEAMYLVAECKSNFETLPSSIRDEFKTVENYLSYVSDKSNLDDCLKRGLIDESSVPAEVLNNLYKEVTTESTPVIDVQNANSQSQSADSAVTANG